MGVGGRFVKYAFFRYDQDIFFFILRHHFFLRKKKSLGVGLILITPIRTGRQNRVKQVKSVIFGIWCKYR